MQMLGLLELEYSSVKFWKKPADLYNVCNSLSKEMLPLTDLIWVVRGTEKNYLP